MDNTLGVVVMASVLRISVARGVLEAAKLTYTGNEELGMRVMCA